MAKYHVNPNTGNSGSCKSTKGKCPFGSEEEHFSTPEAANQAAEKLMAEQYSVVNSAYRKKDPTAVAGMNRELKKRIIAEAVAGTNKLHPSVVAKVFSKDNDELIRKNVSEKFKSQKILREMADDESARVRLAVARATNNPDVLKTLAYDSNIQVRKAALQNAKIPVKVREAAAKTPLATASSPSKASAPAAVNTRSELMAKYSGELTPSSEARLKYMDEQLKSGKNVERTIAEHYKKELLKAPQGARGKYAIDDVLMRFDREIERSESFPGQDYKGIKRN